MVIVWAHLVLFVIMNESYRHLLDPGTECGIHLLSPWIVTKLQVEGCQIRRLSFIWIFSWMIILTLVSKSLKNPCLPKFFMTHVGNSCEQWPKRTEIWIVQGYNWQSTTVRHRLSWHSDSRSYPQNKWWPFTLSQPFLRCLQLLWHEPSLYYNFDLSCIITVVHYYTDVKAEVCAAFVSISEILFLVSMCYTIIARYDNCAKYLEF